MLTELFTLLLAEISITYWNEAVAIILPLTTEVKFCDRLKNCAKILPFFFYGIKKVGKDMYWLSYSFISWIDVNTLLLSNYVN